MSEEKPKTDGSSCCDPYASKLIESGFTPFFAYSNQEALDIIKQSRALPFAMIINNVNRKDPSGISGVSQCCTELITVQLQLAQNLVSAAGKLTPNVIMVLSTVELSSHYAALWHSKNPEEVQQAGQWQSGLQRLEAEYFPLGYEIRLSCLTDGSCQMFHELSTLVQFVTSQVPKPSAAPTPNMMGGMKSGIGMSGMGMGMASGMSGGMGMGMGMGMTSGMAGGMGMGMGMGVSSTGMSATIAGSSGNSMPISSSMNSGMTGNTMGGGMSNTGAGNIMGNPSMGMSNMNPTMNNTMNSPAGGMGPSSAMSMGMNNPMSPSMNRPMGGSIQSASMNNPTVVMNAPPTTPSVSMNATPAMASPITSPTAVAAKSPHVPSSSTGIGSGMSNKVVVKNTGGLCYTLGKYIGQGNFGLVYLCSDAFGQEFVLKYAKTNRTQQAVEADWTKELKILFSLTHPNIVRVYDAFVYNNLYYLILEKADGNLREHITKSGYIGNETEVIGIAGQILSGLEHIHNKGIIHRDLHIDNILYKKILVRGANGEVIEKIEVKISDFGISKVLQRGQDLAQTFIGRDFDYAPELLTAHVTSKQSDIYQVGLICYFIRTGKLAVSSADGPMAQVITSGLAQRNAQSLGGKLGPWMGRLLSVNPAHRPRTCQEAWMLLQQQ